MRDLIRSHSENPDHSAAASFVDVLRKVAELRPDDTAFIFEGGRGEKYSALTYGELYARSLEVAAALCAPPKPVNVALLYPQTPDFLYAFFGCLIAGCNAVPLFPPLREREQVKTVKILENCRAETILTSTAFYEQIAGWVASLHLPWPVQVRATDAPLAAARQPGVVVKAEDIAFLQYTSGSTGTPKGVIVTHANLLHNMKVIRHVFESDRHDVVGVGWLPFYHDMGLIGNILQPLYLGRPYIILSPLTFLTNAPAWLQAITDFGATCTGAPNFAYELCTRRVSAEQLQRLDLSSLEIAFCGAEPIRESTLNNFAEKFAACGFKKSAYLPCYGLAENTLIASGFRLKSNTCSIHVSKTALNQNNTAVPCGPDEEAVALVSSGLAENPYHRILIVDPQTRRRCEDGRVGEIWIQGGSVAGGYYNLEAETEETFRAYTAAGAGPFLRTGDLGFRLDGHLYFTGRCKDVIVINGANYYPQDIEQTVEQASDEIRKGCLAAFSVIKGSGEKVHIVAELRSQGMLQQQREQLVRDIKQVVVKHYRIPVDDVTFIRKGSIPKTSSGKIKRLACRAMLEKNALKQLA